MVNIMDRLTGIVEQGISDIIMAESVTSALLQLPLNAQVVRLHKDELLGVVTLEYLLTDYGMRGTVYAN